MSEQTCVKTEQEKMLTDLIKDMYGKEIDDMVNDREDVKLLSMGDFARMMSDVSKAYYEKLKAERYRKT